jgi:phage terminase small subunit
MTVMVPVPVGPPKRRTRKYSSKPMVVVPPDSELGPAMLALTPIRRRFVMELANGPTGYGSHVRAARAAGYTGSDETVDNQGWNLAHHPKVQDALREVGAKMVRVSAFQAIRQVEKIATDADHKDCLKACLSLMDRGGFAVETHHTVTVQHKTLDDEALEALRTMRELNATREQMETMFGKAGLLRYENMLADKAAPIIEETVQ